jgi:hypothetical protein
MPAAWESDAQRLGLQREFPGETPKQTPPPTRRNPASFKSFRCKNRQVFSLVSHTCKRQDSGMRTPPIKIKVTAMPPFVSVSVDLPTDRLWEGVLARSTTVPLRPELVASTVKELFEDQFTDGDASGAWSKTYPEYLRFIYGKSLPGDLAVRDTISYSAWIGNSLHNFQKLFPEHELALAIAVRLSALRDYLHRHFDNASGAFGLRARPTSRGTTRVSPDLRHTAWAMLTLSRIGVDDQATATMLTRGAEFLRKELSEINFPNERAITFAVLHLLLSSEVVSQLVFPTDRSRNATLKRLESKLVEDFDHRFFTWDTRFDPPEQAAIDNALFVLYCVPPSACLDSDCSNVLSQASRYLTQTALVYAEPDSAGLPFCMGDRPNIGTTALFLWLLLRDKSVETDRKTLVQLARFVNAPTLESPEVERCLPWQKAAILDLVGRSPATVSSDLSRRLGTAGRRLT